jgi:quinoprotein glucose dehydrogenase
VVGAAGKNPYHDPVVMWLQTTPPGGIFWVKNDLYVATLRSESLIRIRMETADREFKVSAIERWFATDNFSGKYGRLRDVVSGPDKSLYVLTSNRDGRGRQRPDDDKILRILLPAKIADGTRDNVTEKKRTVSLIINSLPLRSFFI